MKQTFDYCKPELTVLNVQTPIALAQSLNFITGLESCDIDTRACIGQQEGIATGALLFCVEGIDSIDQFSGVQYKTILECPNGPTENSSPLVDCTQGNQICSSGFPVSCPTQISCGNVISNCATTATGLTVDGQFIECPANR